MVAGIFNKSIFNDAIFNTGTVTPIPESLGSPGLSIPYLGPARFRTTRDEQHPSEIRKRELEAAYQKAITTEKGKLEAEAIVGPYIQTGLAQLKPEFIIDWHALSEAEAQKLIAIQQRLEEEEYILMLLLLS